MEQNEDRFRAGYDKRFQVSLSIALILFIFLFLGLRDIKMRPYLPKSAEETILENIQEEVELLKEPPPPPKPTLPVEAVEEGEEVEEEEIAPTTEFSEVQEQPVLPQIKVYESYEVDEPPQPVYKAEPIYPEMARKLGIEGKVFVRFVVTPDGTVRDPEIVKSAHEIFNAPVLQAIRQWRFKPGTQLGTPVPVRVIQPLEFELER